MKNNYFFTFVSIAIFSLLFCSKVISKQLDTLIFNNIYEKKAFINYINGNKVDPISFLISINYTDKSQTIQETINGFLMKLEKSGIRNLPEKKRIKVIYKKVHSTFFQKYSEKVYFSDIFTNGNYNCVTASALYALVFDHFNIEYSIKKSPEHVYLVADPNGEQVVVETTIPTNGLFVFNDFYKKSYIEYLKENKLISENEYKTESIDELFQQQINLKQSLNIYQLAALQYYNSSLTYYNSEKYDEAIKCLEKAEVLYDDKAIVFLKNNALLNILSDQNTKKKYSGKTLAKYLNTNNKSSGSIENAAKFFSVVSNELVINHPNVKEYQQYFNDLTTFLSDSINKDDFYQTYNETLGYYYYTSSDLQKSLYYLNNSYKYNPENIRIKQTITDVIGRYLMFDSDFENRVDSLELYIQKFPFITLNTTIQQYLVYSFSKTINNKFESGKFNQGKQYIERFELFIKKGLLKDASSDLLGGVFKIAYSYYFRNHDYSKAEEYLNRGLEIVPNSNELQSTNTYFQSSKNELFKWAKENNYTYKDEQLSLNNETISYINNVAENREQVSLFVNSYLTTKQWKLDSIAKGSKIVKVPIKEQVFFTFNIDKSVKIKDNSGEYSGTWCYNDKESTLSIENCKKMGNMNIVIYEVDSKTIKSVVSVDKGIKMAITVFKSL